MESRPRLRTLIASELPLSAAISSLSLLMLKSARLSPENTADWVMQKIIPTHAKMVLAGIALIMARNAPRAARTTFEPLTLARAALG